MGDIGSITIREMTVQLTLSHVTTRREVVLQVMNTSPVPVTVYKGMKLGEPIPRCNVLLIDKKNHTAPNHSQSVPEFNLDSTDLTSTEKSQLHSLLAEFAELFACKGDCVGQT